MTYYRYRRRYRSYNYSYKKRTPYAAIDFVPILPDLKEEFFHLPQKELLIFFEHYRNAYGDSAYAYATETYSDWQRKRVKLAGKTLLKLVELLPKVLPTSKKITLLEKLMAYHKKNTTKHWQSHTLNWDNFREQIAVIRGQVGNNIYVRANISDAIKATMLPVTIKNTATWLFDDDMVVAEKIICDSIEADFKRATASAINDLALFEKGCIALYESGDVYQDMDLYLETPTQRIHICLPAKKRSFLERLFG